MSDGKLYEELIYRFLYSQSFTQEIDYYGEPYVKEFYYVNKNVRINSEKTNTTRQVDVLLKNMLPHIVDIAVECKDHTSPIDVTAIESFKAKCDILGVNGGWFYSSSGFTRTANEYAKKTLGINLYPKPKEHLFYLLSHSFDCFVEPSSFTCLKCGGGISVDYVRHVITPNGKYIKVYMGICSECFDFFLIDNISYTRTLFATFNNSDNSHTIIMTPIKSNKGLEYSFENNDLQVYYRGNPCFIFPKYL